MLSMQKLIEENAFLRDENRRLAREFDDVYDKAKTFDLLVALVKVLT
ncbi:hypothetical protein MKL29_00860 [Streptococcus suis]|nr:hypothetical protein [Streptococcus suis]